MTTHARRNLRRPVLRVRGFGLVEIMVGVTIGLLALLIVYQVLALAEGYRRTTTAGGDAQSAGMIATFVLGQDLANAGNVIADSGSELATCPSTGVFATTWRPIPVLIRDGGNDFTSDSFDVFYGVNTRLVTPVDLMTSAPPGAVLRVQSIVGFAVNDMVIASDIGTGACEMETVTAINPQPLGVVEVTTTPRVNTYPQGTSWVVNLGPANLVRKMRYDVAAGILRSQDLIAAAVPNPIVSNVVLLKAQYGLDLLPAPNGDNVIDTWMPARAAPWREADVLAAPLAQLRRIKAIRIAAVVRSSQFERPIDAEGRAAVANLTADFTTTLFDCRGLLPCTGELTAVTIPGTANYRYRVFEQVIPLRNQIWNPS